MREMFEASDMVTTTSNWNGILLIMFSQYTNAEICAEKHVGTTVVYIKGRLGTRRAKETDVLLGGLAVNQCQYLIMGIELSICVI